jgi:hypothetical protein
VALDARLWVLNLSDGEHSLLDIAERSGISFSIIRDAADLLYQNRLLLPVTEDGGGGTARAVGSRENNFRLA